MSRSPIAPTRLKSVGLGSRHIQVSVPVLANSVSLPAIKPRAKASSVPVPTQDKAKTHTIVDDAPLAPSSAGPQSAAPVESSAALGLTRTETWAASTWLSRHRRKPKVPDSEKTFGNPELTKVLHEVNMLSFGLKWLQHHVAKAWRTWHQMAVLLKRERESRQRARTQEQRERGEGEPEVAMLAKRRQSRHSMQRAQAVKHGAASEALHAERLTAAAMYYAKTKAKADDAFREGRFDECTALLDMCNEVSEDNDVLHNYRSRTYAKSWELEGALEDAETAVDIAPDAHNKLQLGRTLQQLRRLGEAGSSYLDAGERGGVMADGVAEGIRGLIADVRRDRSYFRGFLPAVESPTIHDAPTLRRKRTTSRHVTIISSEALDD